MNNNRNYGIDLLRMICMFMVIIVHINTQGGVYANTIKMSGSYEAAWLLEIIVFCAVDCFGLISGYVGAEAKFNPHKIILMWFQVIFYTLLITICFNIFMPSEIGRKDWLNAFFPVSTSQYWYFRAYFGLFFFMPYLNKMLNALKRRELFLLGIAIIVFFSIWQTGIQNEIFGTQKGYNLLWLTLLYLLGGIIRKLNDKITFKKSTCVIIFWGTIFLSWGWKYIIEAKFPENLYANIFISYISPTVLLCAVVLLMLFKEIRIDGHIVKKLIMIGAPSAFDVYLIHAHPLIYNRILYWKFEYVARYSPVHLIAAIITVSSVIYICCTIIGIVRIEIFKLVKINKISFYMVERAKEMLRSMEKCMMG